MVDWKFANKLRPHNRNETMKHFIVKSMVFKLLFNRGDYVYSEYDYMKNSKIRVADIFSEGDSGHNTVVEIETKPTVHHTAELARFWNRETLYIIDVREVPDEIVKMEEYLKFKLGL